MEWRQKTVGAAPCGCPDPYGCPKIYRRKPAMFYYPDKHHRPDTASSLRSETLRVFPCRGVVSLVSMHAVHSEWTRSVPRSLPPQSGWKEIKTYNSRLRPLPKALESRPCSPLRQLAERRLIFYHSYFLIMAHSPSRSPFSGFPSSFLRLSNNLSKYSP